MAFELDRRRSHRSEIDLFVQEILDDRTFLHPAVNLSPDGIYILVHDDRKAIDGDQPVKLELTLPTGRAIVATGNVAWVDDHKGQRGIGIAFRQLDVDDREAIAQYVAGLEQSLERAASA